MSIHKIVGEYGFHFGRKIHTYRKGKGDEKLHDAGFDLK